MSKYKAVPTVLDNIRFHSRKEARRYQELKMLFHYGKIASLELQPRFRLNVGGEHICDYIADFKYVDLETLKPVVEDVKGIKTAVYRIKKKLVKALLNIDIQEV